MAKRKGYGTLGKAAGFLVAFLGIGFFATALDRFMGWNAERSGWKAGAVTLGATLLTYVGLKAMGQSGWAKIALVGGLASTGVNFLARPVNEAGGKLGQWMRDGLNGNSTPRLEQPQQPQAKNTSNPTPSSNQGTQFSGAVPTNNMTPTGMGPAGGAPNTSAPTGGQTSTAPTAIYHVAAPKPPSTLETIVGAVTQLGVAGLGALGASFGAPAGSKGSPDDHLWLARV